MALLFSLVVALVLPLTMGRCLEAPAQIPEKADCFVALGSDTVNRIRKSFDVYRDGYVDYVLTGMEGGDPVTRHCNLSWHVEVLLAQGAPQVTIEFDKASAST